MEIPKISPYDALFHVALNYTSLRIFGCACYPWLRPYWSHKLELKSIKCVFVRYSLQHKGYRCLDPSTSRVYISKHVIFEELMFTFSETRPVSSSLHVSNPLVIFGPFTIFHIFFTYWSIPPLTPLIHPSHQASPAHSPLNVVG